MLVMFKNSSNQAIIENKVGHIGLCSGPDFFPIKSISERTVLVKV